MRACQRGSARPGQTVDDGVRGIAYTIMGDPIVPGLQITRLEFGPGAELPLRKLELAGEETLLVGLTGLMVVTEADEESPLGPGDVIVLDRHTIWGIRNAGDDPAAVLVQQPAESLPVARPMPM